ncbi:hypothetical protein, variant [Aphanomyces invadans]|uniref:MYND-type domain-containing protein n=1 Tax=Aphanomyces invadans TaxID=157072 RepID=A0A024UJY7_9STRA|nr:hypothetical protein, variant [Aphanomyces invadans]ETW06766.1 hypothetical protein, variant [Aphanomyces invadans]|eukprot:XP_008864841.1 hypothetical protein, variant [Aphanomyces invadans]
MSTPSASYDEICEKGKEEAEQRLIDHFKDNGGEVWNIRSGCMGCKTNPNNVPLKTCSQCKTALFCSKDCQKTAWKTHKHECLVISTMSHNEADNAEISSIITSCLETFSWSHDIKTTSDPLLTKVAKSIGLDGPSYPGWFCTVNLVNVCRVLRLWSRRFDLVASCGSICVHSSHREALLTLARRSVLDSRFR